MSCGSAACFACHECGACCTGLRERGRNRGFAELAPGVYRQPGEGGLRVFAWEADLFPADRLAPLLVAADGAQRERVVLAYELRADDCPNFEHDTKRCNVYEDRPLVCRAFPLLVEATEDGPTVAASSVCGARVPLQAAEDGEDGEDGEAPDVERLARAYPQAFAPALAVPQLVSWLLELVGFLDHLGAVDPMPGLSEDQLAGLEPATSIVDRVVETGAMEAGELAQRARERVERIRQRAVARQG